MGEAGDDEGELEGGFPFSESVCGDDDSLLDGDLAQPGDHKFSADDDAGYPDRTETFGVEIRAEVDESSRY